MESHYEQFKNGTDQFQNNLLCHNAIDQYILQKKITKYHNALEPSKQNTRKVDGQ